MDLTNLNKDRKTRRKSSSLELGTMMYGKVPPQARDLEEAVLGACLSFKGAFDIVIEILKPECFYVDAHTRVYRSMMSLLKKSSPIDILTVTEELRYNEELDLVGGPYYVTRLTNSIVSAANIEAHSLIILQKFLQRELIRISTEIIGEAYEDSADVFDLINDAENRIFAVSTSYIKKDYSHIEKGLVKVINKIESLRLKDDSLTGIPSQYKEMDRITHGWQKANLIILAARPSVGKTAFALNLARNAALHPINPTPVGFFSLEMNEEQLIARILSNESEIWLERISTGRLDDEQMKTLYRKGVNPLAASPIYIDDTAALNMFELRSKARRMVNKHSVGLIIVDYLQLMGSDSNKNGNREQEISKISRDLKRLSKELDVPIIALSQLSREVEKRGKGNKQPQLSDLRESGAIEQDADLVIFLYRPPDDEVSADADLKNKGMIQIAKNRNGNLIKLAFEVSNDIQRWTEKGVLGSAGNLIPLSKANENQAQIYIQKGAKLFDESNDPDEDMPF